MYLGLKFSGGLNICGRPPNPLHVTPEPVERSEGVTIGAESSLDVILNRKLRPRFAAPRILQLVEAGGGQRVLTSIFSTERLPR